MSLRQSYGTGGPVADRHSFALWIVGATALAVRIVVAIALDGLKDPHLEEYDLLARNLLAGRGFAYPHLGIVYYSYISPLPVWIIAASYWLTGSLIAAMILQIVAGATQAVLTSLVARRLFGGLVAPFAAGMLVALHPGLVVYSASRSHALAFDALLFTLAILLAFRLVERSTMTRAAHFGLTIGIGVLSRATILLFLPVVVTWLLMVTPRSMRRAAIYSGVVACVCAVAVIAPWTIRNSLLHEQFVLLRTTDSETFWRGNNPDATGTSYIDADRTVLSALPAAEMRDLEQQPDELAQAQWFKARARAFIREHPAAFIRLTLLKFYYFWWYAPTTGLLYPAVWFQAYMAYYVIVLLLAAVAISRMARVGGPGLPLALLIGACLLVVSSFQSLYYVEGRHRWAVESLVLVFSGGGVASLLIRRSARGDARYLP